eukprot:473439_1
MSNATIVFEILRDVWQTVSLILEQIEYELSGVISKIFSFSIWADLTSLCFSCYLDNKKLSTTVTQLLFIIQSFVALIAVGIFNGYASNDIKYDREDKYTPEARGTARKMIYLSTLVLTTLYLPLVRDVTRVLACDESFLGETYIQYLDINSCYVDIHWLFIFGAVIVAGFYIIWTPYLLYSVIENKKPQPIFFDDTGAHKEFTDEDYQNEISKQTKSPYKSLYNGYQREHSHYKVITMIFKLVLTIPAALFVANNYVQNQYGTSYNTQLGGGLSTPMLGGPLFFA